MTRMLMIAAMFGLAVAASGCTQSNPSLADNQAVTMNDVPELSGSSMPEPVSRPIDFHDSRAYGNAGGL